ncbi:MAG: hypothetical protein RI897_135 [Verrucomicrobiota bacterium]
MEFPDIALGERDGGGEFPGLAGGEFPIGEDMAEVEAGGDGVDEPAAADSAGLAASDDVAGPAVTGGIDLGDGAGGGAHAVGDAGAFESGAGGGARADELVAVTGDDFPVGAEVDEGLDGVLLMEAGDVEAGEDITADEAAEAGEEADLGCGGQGPVQVGWGELKQAEIGGFEGGVGERGGVDSAEEVVHRGVSDDEDVVEVGELAGVVGEERLDELVDFVADELGEILGAVMGGGEFHPGHDIGPVAGLGVEGGGGGEDFAGLEVKELGGERGGAEVDGDTESVGGGEFEVLFVGEDGGFPLGEFESEVGGECGLAGESPACLDGLGGEELLVGWSDREFTLDYFHPAATAASASTAGEFGAGVEEDILEGGIGRQVERLAGWFEMKGGHGGLEGEGHAAEVVTDDEEFDCVGELFRAGEEGGEHGLPVGTAAAVPDAEEPEGFDEGFDVCGREAESGSGGAVLFEEGADALGVVFGFVESAHEFAVTVLEKLAVEDGLEVQGGVGVVAGAFVLESAFAHEALVEARLGEGGEEADHGGDDAGVLDEFELTFEDILGVMIEADDESAHDLESGLLEGLDGADEVAAAVEEFAAFLEAFEGRGFDADEDLFEAGLDHEGAEFGVIGEVD